MRFANAIFLFGRPAIAILTLFCSVFVAFAEGGGAQAGFIFDQFQLTLEAGQRTEAAGPFFYSEQKESESTLAVPPLFSEYRNEAVENSEFDLLYPFLTYERYAGEWRWQFFQLFSFAGGRQADDFQTHRFTLFPIYFQQRSLDTNLVYTAVVPFYGHLKNRLFRDEIFFVMFPIYGQSRKQDVVTDNYFYPFVHVRRGDGLHGWQVWPLVGSEHKVLTTVTNGFGDVTTVGGHDQSFVLWPFWLSQDNGLGTENPEKSRASIPAFAVTRSPNRDATTVLWPFFSWIDEREKKYHEWEGPWPFVIFTRGEGKTTSRVWPVFSQSHNATIESDSYIWPVYRYKRIHSDPLDQRSTRIAFYLYVGITEKNTETGAEKKRRDMWPFFTWRRDFDGNSRLQIFAPIESILASNRGIERNWSPLWSLWRVEKNARNGRVSDSLFWNLYRREAAPGRKKISLLFGLFQYQRDGDDSRTRIFYVPVPHPQPR
jgi:hypothetical protein